MAACFKDEITAWCVDDKNKLLVGGGPCVDRRLSFKSYFMKEDMVHYPDHNFATGYKIIPSGYMQLLIDRPESESHSRTEKLSRSTNPERTPPKPTQETLLHQDPLNLSSRPPSTFRYDRLGRQHFAYPRTRPLILCLRGNKFFKAPHGLDPGPLFTRRANTATPMQLS